MKDKKDIDRLFREQFRDFEVKPDEKLWENIKAKLTEEKDRKVFILPLWSKIAGVAALLALLFLIGNHWFKPTPSSTIVDSTKEKQEEVVPAKITETDKETPTDSFATENAAQENAADDSFGTNQGVEGIASESEQDIKKSKSGKGESIEKDNRNLMDRKEVADRQADPSTKMRETPETDMAIAQKTEADWKKLERAADKENLKENEVKPIVDHLVKAEKDEKERSLWDEIAKKEKEDLSVTQPGSRFSIRPNIAPIYYSSIGGGSALDPQFADNRAQGQVTMAYGIDLAYAISKQIKLRTGISKVNMSYNTPDIAFAGGEPRNIMLKALSKEPALGDNVVMNSIGKPNMDFSGKGEAVMNSGYTEGKLNQELAYIEVPLEIEFALVEKKFGVSLIGGASTLILSNDAIQLSTAGRTTDLGRATNVNSLSFTTNFGVGLGYNFSKQIKLSLEPTFKYHLNGFQGRTGDFRPYYIGVYSGVSFKF